jgi:DNA-binding Xre family transcriptional regulator
MAYQKIKKAVSFSSSNAIQFLQFWTDTTVLQMAEKAGLSKASAYALNRPATIINIHIATLQKIAKVFDCNIQQLLSLQQKLTDNDRLAEKRAKNVLKQAERVAQQIRTDIQEETE